MRFTFAMLLTFVGFGLVNEERFLLGAMTSVIGLALLLRLARKEGRI
jgi:hypothetical protein